MKYLILARHGVDDFKNNGLSEEGVKQMKELANSLKCLFQENNVSSVTINSSMVTRVVESARIVAEILGLDSVVLKRILSAPLHPHDSKLAIRLMELYEEVSNSSANADALILFTHLPQIQLFPAYYAKRVWDIEGFPDRGVSCGQAFVICCDIRSYQIMPYK
jgi:phosphohistidine phosphatase SixA